MNRAKSTIIFAACGIALFAVALFLIYPSVSRESSASLSNTQRAALIQLEQASGYRSFGCVLKDGEIIRRWGIPFELYDRGLGRSELGWGSASKPFLSTILLLAMEDGKLQTIDTPIAEFLFEIEGKDRGITFRHLIDQTSGYSLSEGPGEAWAYNDIAVRLLSEVLTQRVLDLPTREGLTRWLFAPNHLGPLGIDAETAISIANNMPRVNMSPCEYARVGWLWANDGVWNGQQLMQRDLTVELKSMPVNASISRAANHFDDVLNVGTAGAGNNQDVPIGPGLHGAFWWINADQGLFSDLPEGSFHANGYWNVNSMTVIPESGLVIAIRDAFALRDATDFRDNMNAALSPVYQAFQ